MKYIMYSSKILTRLCWELGYVVKKRKEHFKLVAGEDPLELPYFSKLPFTLMKLPLALGVGLRFYPLSYDTHHPFILALLKGKNKKDSKLQAYEILKKYSELVNFKNANDFLGIPNEEAIFSKESHPYEVTYPWSILLPQEVKKNYQGYFSMENQKYDLASDECLESTYVSETKIQLETTRLLDLKNSIENNGYKLSGKDVIGASVFVKDGKWKWFVEGGQHRAAVVAALGMEKVPVYVKHIVRREDFKLWPGVQRKIYSSKNALRLFDRLFNLEPPFIAKNWINYVDNFRTEKKELEGFKNLRT